MGDLANPLQALIAGAARSTPAVTGEVERTRARLDAPGAAVVVLADCSSSMAERAGARTKADLLAEALDSVLPDLPGATLIGFATTAAGLPSAAHLPAPAGGTALHLALDLAAGLRPGRTLVVSDGRPDDEARALAAAGGLPGIIDVIYCGPDDDAAAIDFMRRLARLGCGRVVVRDVVRDRTARLAPAARALLGLPGPGA
jgi:hypothetical protein